VKNQCSGVAVAMSASVVTLLGCRCDFTAPRLMVKMIDRIDNDGVLRHQPLMGVLVEHRYWSVLSVVLDGQVQTLS
jgi:hypothetical protein